MRAPRLLVCIAGISCIALGPMAIAQMAEQPVQRNVALPDPLAALPKLDPGQARIFFLRESRFVAVASAARIKLDGDTVGWVASGAAVFIDHAPGQVWVGIGGAQGRSDFTLTLEPGKQYFMELGPHPGGAVGYLLSHLDAVEQHCNFDSCAALIEKGAALPKLSEMSISGGNPNAD